MNLIVNYANLIIFLRKFGNFNHVLEALSIVLKQVDFVKDGLLLFRMIHYLGGMYVVFKNPHIFSSNVSSFVIVIPHL